MPLEDLENQVFRGIFYREKSFFNRRLEVKKLDETCLE